MSEKELPGWRDVTNEVLGQGNDSDGDNGTIEEEYPGIPKAEFDEAVALYMENPYWCRYYETAPSEVCKEFITMEFYNSEHQTPEAEDVLREMEDELGLEDWKHLLKYCGNNPRRAFITKVIEAFMTHDNPRAERTGRALLNPYYQVIVSEKENENDDQP